MKALKVVLIVFVCFFIIGCKDKDAMKVINKNYIEKNNGIIFDKYAIALDENKNKDIYALFIKKNNDRYEKVDSIPEYKKDSNILFANKYIYFFEKEGSFIGYKIDSSLKKFEPSFDDIDGLIYFPNEIFGFSDNYIYLSYYENDKKTDVLYAKVKYDLSSYESIKESDLLDEYEYLILDKS